MAHDPKPILHALDLFRHGDVEDGALAAFLPTTHGPALEKRTPVDGSVLGRVRTATLEDYAQVSAKVASSFAGRRRASAFVDRPSPRQRAIARATRGTMFFFIIDLLD